VLSAGAPQFVAPAGERFRVPPLRLAATAHRGVPHLARSAFEQRRALCVFIEVVVSASVRLVVAQTAEANLRPELNSRNELLWKLSLAITDTPLAPRSLVTRLVSRNSSSDTSCRSSHGGTFCDSNNRSPAPPISKVYLARRPISRCDHQIVRTVGRGLRVIGAVAHPDLMHPNTGSLGHVTRLARQGQKHTSIRRTPRASCWQERPAPYWRGRWCRPWSLHRDSASGAQARASR
jgi:hypothetical protein